MNRKTVRAFALGILISVSLIGAFYYINKKEENKLTSEKARAFLEADGFVVLTNEQFNNTEKELAEAEEKATKAETELKEKQTAPQINQEEAIIIFNLKIVSRMLLQDVAQQLEEAKIIDDAGQFKQYMVDYGFSRKLQPGTYKLTSDMSFKEIAKMITKGKNT